ncbi:MAG: divergent PAP2 family protein [Patescibacteria group bacterium]
MIQIIFIPIVAGLLCQLLKLLISAAKGEFSWGEINSYGGMPSSHAAFVSSLAFVAGYYEGWNSVAFAIAVVFAILTIRDAIGFRRTLGKHAQVINEVIHLLPESKRTVFKTMPTRLGHTPIEALAGIIIGIAVPFIYIIFSRYF